MMNITNWWKICKCSCIQADISYLFGIKTAPACPPLPSKSTFILAGAAMAVTIRIDVPELKYKSGLIAAINRNHKDKISSKKDKPSSYRIGPCSICNSTKAG